MNHPRTTAARSRGQLGFSLVEMMVAMLLGIVLTIAVAEIFIGSKQTYRMRDRVAALTDGGRFAVEMMQREIRMAGYSGCRTLGSLPPNVVAKNAPSFSEVEDGFQGFDDGAGWTNPTGTTRIAGTDVLVATHASGAGVPLTEDMADRAASLKVGSATTVIADDQLLLISDCEAADLLRTTTVTESGGTYTIAHGTSGNTDNLLSKAYSKNAMVNNMGSTTFFVGENADGEGSLYMIAFGSTTPVALVDGVQDMQILYAVDTNNNGEPDDYVDASTVGDWADVLGVNVGILLHTDDNVTKVPQPLNFNGADANPSNDKRLRTAFWSAVALRNRMK